MTLSHPASLYGVASLDPTGKTFVEHSRVFITSLIQHAIGQTGQVMGASSIQDYGSVSWDLCEVERDLAERDRKGGLDVGLFIFLTAADIHDKRLLPLDDGVRKLIQSQISLIALAIDDPRRVYLDPRFVAYPCLGSARTLESAFDVGQAMGRGAEHLFLVLAMGAPIGAVKFDIFLSQMLGQGTSLRLLRA